MPSTFVTIMSGIGTSHVPTYPFDLKVNGGKAQHQDSFDEKLIWHSADVTRTIYKPTVALTQARRRPSPVTMPLSHLRRGKGLTTNEYDFNTAGAAIGHGLMVWDNVPLPLGAA